MTGAPKKVEPSRDDRIDKLEREVAEIKELMRRNGWTVNDGR